MVYLLIYAIFLFVLYVCVGYFSANHTMLAISHTLSLSRFLCMPTHNENSEQSVNHWQWAVTLVCYFGECAHIHPLCAFSHFPLSCSNNSFELTPQYGESHSVTMPKLLLASGVASGDAPISTKFPQILF